MKTLNATQAANAIRDLIRRGHQDAAQLIYEHYTTDQGKHFPGGTIATNRLTRLWNQGIAYRGCDIIEINPATGLPV